MKNKTHKLEEIFLLTITNINYKILNTFLVNKTTEMTILLLFHACTIINQLFIPTKCMLRQILGVNLYTCRKLSKFMNFFTLNLTNIQFQKEIIFF